MRDGDGLSRISYPASRIPRYEHGDRMWRNGRPLVPGPGGRRGAARARPRSDSLRFGKGDRFAGNDGARGISLRETADRRVPVAVFAEDLRVSRALRGKPSPLPKHLSQVQTTRGPRDGRVHLDSAGARGKNGRRPDVYPRIECDSGESESPDGTNGSRGSARLQGMRAVFFERAHRSHWHTDPQRTATSRSQSCAAETRSAGRSDYAFGDGRKSGGERNQSSRDQVPAVAARFADPGHPSFRRARRTPRGRQLSARKNSRIRGGF